MECLAAKLFVETFYQSLNYHRDRLASFYTPPFTMPDGRALPAIVWNGNIVPDPLTLQNLFEQEMPKSVYTVQNYDCHVLNPNYVAEGTQGGDAISGANMTIMIVVSGFVKYGEARSATQRGFSDSFILVPNPTAGATSRVQDRRHWLVQSHNSRLVV